jgi:hypothetical protein
MLVLPAVDENNASLGDRLKIDIKLKETGVQQFLKENFVHHIKEQPVDYEKLPSCSWKQKIVNKLTGGTKIG